MKVDLEVGLEINTFPFVPHRINYQYNYCGTDKPNLCHYGAHWWNNYTIQDFDYKFNSWGFRDDDFEQYIGKKVNICLGDSMTINIGGPIEHSWCSQLAKHFDIPTLNFGMEAAGNDAIRLVHDRACKIFDVQNTFVMYSFLHRRLVNNKFEQTVLDDSENFAYFLEHRVQNAFECTIPAWSYTDKEKAFLVEQGLYFLNVSHALYFSDHHTIDRKFIDPKSYNKFRGPDWPTLEQFVQGAEPHPDMFTKKFGAFVSSGMFRNRDGVHMNQESNQQYADYFYNQWRVKT